MGNSLIQPWVRLHPFFEVQTPKQCNTFRALRKTSANVALASSSAHLSILRCISNAHVLHYRYQVHDKPRQFSAQQAIWICVQTTRRSRVHGAQGLSLSIHAVPSASASYPHSNCPVLSGRWWIRRGRRTRCRLTHVKLSIHIPDWPHHDEGTAVYPSATVYYKEQVLRPGIAFLNVR